MFEVRDLKFFWLLGVRSLVDLNVPRTAETFLSFLATGKAPVYNSAPRQRDTVLHLSYCSLAVQNLARPREWLLFYLRLKGCPGGILEKPTF